VVYRWLLFSRTQCGERLVIGGDPTGSALVRKLEDDVPACGGPMPPKSVMAADPVKMVERMNRIKTEVRDWIAAGAFAPQCGMWSDAAPRIAGLDAGTEMGTPDWSKLYSDVVGPRCATAACHDAKTKAGELNLADACGAYAALQGSGPCGKRLAAGSPEQSSFYLRLTTPEQLANPACHSLMPPGAPLPSFQVAQIRDWIAAGASAASCP
jgi:hypothetical protein